MFVVQEEVPIYIHNYYKILLSVYWPLVPNHLAFNYKKMVDHQFSNQNRKF